MKFGLRSKKKLYKCHRDLVLIHETAIENIRVDYGIHDSARSVSEQLLYFLNGKSTIDPRKGVENAKHVITPDRPRAMATDIHIATKYKDKSLTWQKDHLLYVVAYMIGIADMLYEDNKITHRLRSGVDWDMDGVILIDQNFDDYPHIELIKP